MLTGSIKTLHVPLKNTKIRFTCQNKTRKILSVLSEEVKQGELVALKTIPLDLKDVD